MSQIHKTLLVTIIVTALFLRLYNIEKLTSFTGEEGRDFRIVAKITKREDFTLLGPTIGPYNKISQIYLGPAYYYLIAPSLFLFSHDPIGPSIFIAIVSTFTVFVIYKIGASFLSPQVGFIAAALYATNPYLVDIGRSSNPAFYTPIATAFLIYALFNIRKRKRPIYFVIAGIALGFLIQFHYTTIVAFVMTFIVLLTLKPRLQLKNYLLVIFTFLVTVSPLILFESRHRLFILNSILAQIKYRSNYDTSTRHLDFITTSIQKLFAFLIFPNVLLILIAIITILFAAIIFLRKSKERDDLRWIFFYMFLWVIANLVIVFFYSGPFQHHYFATSFIPLLFVLATSLVTLNRFAKIGTVMAIVIVLANIMSLDLKRDHGYNMPAGWNLVGVKTASRIIAQNVQEQGSFNVAATLDGDSRAMPYRYLVEIAGKKPESVENYPNVNTLFLVARDDKEAIKSYTVWEVASFAPFVVEKQWHIQNGINLYKLKKSINGTENPI